MDADFRCRYCGAPLNCLYPDAPYRLRWGHISVEDADQCSTSSWAGEWPEPEQAEPVDADDHDLTEVVRAIRRLHWPSRDRDSSCDCYDGLEAPCPTIAALDAVLTTYGTGDFDSDMAGLRRLADDVMVEAAEVMRGPSSEAEYREWYRRYRILTAMAAPPE